MLVLHKEAHRLTLTVRSWSGLLGDNPIAREIAHYKAHHLMDNTLGKQDLQGPRQVVRRGSCTDVRVSQAAVGAVENHQDRPRQSCSSPSLLLHRQSFRAGPSARTAPSSTAEAAGAARSAGAAGAAGTTAGSGRPSGRKDNNADQMNSFRKLWDDGRGASFISSTIPIFV